jgi:hypothetical protein
MTAVVEVEHAAAAVQGKRRAGRGIEAERSLIEKKKRDSVGSQR